MTPIAIMKTRKRSSSACWMSQTVEPRRPSAKASTVCRRSVGSAVSPKRSKYLGMATHEARWLSKLQVRVFRVSALLTVVFSDGAAGSEPKREGGRCPTDWKSHVPLLQHGPYGVGGGENVRELGVCHTIRPDLLEGTVRNEGSREAR